MASILRIMPFFTFIVFAMVIEAQAAYHNTREAGLTGGSKCSDYLCVNVTSDASTVQYVVKSTGFSKTTGWLAIGFGKYMSDSSMVIVWANPDGTTTLSQRTSPSGEAMPELTSSPSRVATLLPELTDMSGAMPQFGFSIPADGNTTQSIIWAISDKTPTSAQTDAEIKQHVGEGFGQFLLDFSQSVQSPLAASMASSSSATTFSTSDLVPRSSVALSSIMMPSTSSSSPKATPSSKQPGACRFKRNVRRNLKKINRSWSPIPLGK